MLVAGRARIRCWLTVPVFVTALLLWDYITVLDDWFSIPGGTLMGRNSYPSNHPGMNTPHLSVILCPIAFLAGAVGGTIAGHILSKRRQL